MPEDCWDSIYKHEDMTVAFDQSVACDMETLHSPFPLRPAFEVE